MLPFRFPILDAFAKLRKATISFVMSVCPSVRLSAWSNSAPTGGIFMKFDEFYFLICGENSSFVKIWQEYLVLYRNIWYFTWIPMYIYDNCFNGAAVASGPHYGRFTIIHTQYSIGLLWASDQPDAETSTWQHTTLKTDIHVPGGILSHIVSKRVAADPRLRPRGRWDRHMYDV